MNVFQVYTDMEAILQKGDNFGVIVEGSAIPVALASPYFAEILEKCQSAVCCRITPKNKA